MEMVQHVFANNWCNILAKTDHSDILLQQIKCCGASTEPDQGPILKVCHGDLVSWVVPWSECSDTHCDKFCGTLCAWEVSATRPIKTRLNFHKGTAWRPRFKEGDLGWWDVCCGSLRWIICIKTEIQNDRV